MSLHLLQNNMYLDLLRLLYGSVLKILVLFVLMIKEGVHTQNMDVDEGSDQNLVSESFAGLEYKNLS